MIELILGLIFLFLMFMPFTLGEDMLDTPLPSLGLILLVLAYLAYFNNVFLPLPLILNKSIVASFAIVDSIFELFFGLGINDFGAGNLVIFLISLSISYTLLNYMLASLTMLSPRAKEFITLAILFVIARTTTTGQNNLIFLMGSLAVQMFVPTCALKTFSILPPLEGIQSFLITAVSSPFSIIGPMIALTMLIIMGFQLTKGWMSWLILIVTGVLMVVFLVFRENFYACIGFWLVQLAAILFTVNLVLQAISLDWMKGIYDELKEEAGIKKKK